MTRTLLLGGGAKEARRLPASMEMPMTVLTIHIACSEPPPLDSIKAGKAA